eukprot:gnl/MRDRNA2_/MRDRNA2_175496_c0_seq1.p1 gnl/MRDRNA2_/MRDRNA2_175496_c0~~gnl/MRDRNA2_/MRDRNA2_175496_c0_seq1.p1  ORF type:complete len:403 (-),score=71.86 gnl/MRDRNA2_/MRDRNA2_175496_c0_seq1:15-1166(-)
MPAVTAAEASLDLPAAKRAKTDALFSIPFRVVSECPASSEVGIKLIGTHDGVFHCDEALGCAMLQMMPGWAGSTIVRTRNQTELDKCDIVIDVGAVYDHKALRYDHHQRTFSSTLSEDHPDVPVDSRPEGIVTKLSACGLVYKHYGLSELLPILVQGSGFPTKLLPTMYKKIYKSFVEEIDAIDNGIDISEGELKYKINTNISARVAQLNPSWNEDESRDRRNALFRDAMELTGHEFRSAVQRLAFQWWPARSIVEAAVADRQKIHSSGEIMLLPQFCPWKEHLSDLEAEQDIIGLLKYVLFKDSNGAWRVQAVSSEGFALRKALPSTWRGVRDADLSSISGIDGCIFCHNSGFIGGNQTYEGALKMACAALAFVEPVAKEAK